MPSPPESVSNSEDHHPGRRGSSHSGGRRGVDPTARSHQDPAQEQSPDAHQRPREFQTTAGSRPGRRNKVCFTSPFDPSPISLQAFENTLKSWEDKLKYDKPPLRPHLYPQQSVDLATEEEAAMVQLCARAAEELITR